MKIVTRIRQLLSAKDGTVRLEGEGIAEPIESPSEDVLRREIGRLRTTGPSHLALIASDGSYMQAAGNAKRMTVERHFVGAEGERHVVLGRQGPPGSTVTIASTAGALEVRAAEVWAAPEAVELFCDFAETDSVAPHVSCRDIAVDSE